MRTPEGAPVQVVSTAPRKGEDSSPVEFELLRAWLEEQGFAVVSWGDGKILQRGEVQSALRAEKEIEIHVGDEGGEVTVLYCRFTLSRDALVSLERWAEFVQAMCRRFGLRIGASENAPCGAAEFRVAVQQNLNWRRFAKNFGWEQASA
jgi:hypothetical protein